MPLSSVSSPDSRLGWHGGITCSLHYHDPFAEQKNADKQKVLDLICPRRKPHASIRTFV
jgi:hypothetical protein